MSKVALADAQREWAEILDGLDTVEGLDKPDSTRCGRSSRRWRRRCGS